MSPGSTRCSQSDSDFFRKVLNFCFFLVNSDLVLLWLVCGLVLSDRGFTDPSALSYFATWGSRVCAVYSVCSSSAMFSCLWELLLLSHRRGSVCSTQRIARIRHGTAVDRLLIRQTGLSAARRCSFRCRRPDLVQGRTRGPREHQHVSNSSRSHPSDGRNKPSPSLPTAARSIVSTSFITVLTPSNKNGGELLLRSWLLRHTYRLGENVKTQAVLCWRGSKNEKPMKQKLLFQKKNANKMVNIIMKSKGNPYNLFNNKSNTPKKSLTLSSVIIVSPFKYDIKVFHFDQSHGIFRKVLNNINNVRHILFCERVPMRLIKLAY